MNIEVSDEAADGIVAGILKQDVTNPEFMPREVEEAIHRTIAWYSVAGTYEGGKYDAEID